MEDFPHSVTKPPDKYLRILEAEDKMTARSLKITEKVSFNIASEASYVYFLNGQKFIKNAKKWSIWRVFWKPETFWAIFKQCETLTIVRLSDLKICSSAAEQLWSVNPFFKCNDVNSFSRLHFRGLPIVNVQSSLKQSSLNSFQSLI